MSEEEIINTSDVVFDGEEQQIINDFYSDLEKIFYNLIISRIDENDKNQIMYDVTTFKDPIHYFDNFTPMFNDVFFNNFNEKTGRKLFDDKLVDYIIDKLMEHVNISLAKDKSKFRILHFYPDNVADGTKDIIKNEFGRYKKINSKKEYEEIQKEKNVSETSDYFDEQKKKYENIIIN